MPRTLGRTKDHRSSLLRNLGRSLVLNGSVTTTLPKAKELRRLVDGWMTRAKRAAAATKSQRLAHYRVLIKLTHDQVISKRLVTTLAPQTGSRTSGFTRVQRIVTRVGDAAPRGRVMFVDLPAGQAGTPVSKTSKSTAEAAPEIKAESTKPDSKKPAVKRTKKA